MHLLSAEFDVLWLGYFACCLGCNPTGEEGLRGCGLLYSLVTEWGRKDDISIIYTFIYVYEKHDNIPILKNNNFLYSLKIYVIYNVIRVVAAIDIVPLNWYDPFWPKT